MKSSCFDGTAGVVAAFGAGSSPNVSLRPRPVKRSKEEARRTGFPACGGPGDFDDDIDDWDVSKVTCFWVTFGVRIVIAALFTC